MHAETNGFLKRVIYPEASEAPDGVKELLEAKCMEPPAKKKRTGETKSANDEEESESEEQEEGKKKRQEKQPPKATCKAGAKAKAKATAKPKAKGRPKAKAKAKASPQKRTRKTKKETAAEEAERKSKLSRKSAAYHQARTAALKEGKSADVASAAGRKASRQHNVDCIFIFVAPLVTHTGMQTHMPLETSPRLTMSANEDAFTELTISVMRVPPFWHCVCLLHFTHFYKFLQFFP